MATVAVNQFIFKQPVRVGDILSFFAEVTRMGNTSITVQVEVYAERFPRPGPLCEGDRGVAHLCGH
jgi:acyl-CoA thioesterase YciA